MDVFDGTSEGVETIKQALAQIERGGRLLEGCVARNPATVPPLWLATKIHSCAYEETQDRVTRMVDGNYENEQ